MRKGTEARTIQRGRAGELEPLTRIIVIGERNKLSEPPGLQWLPVDKLRVNRAYQRDLSTRSLALIRNITLNWQWRQVKALSVVRVGEAADVVYEVIDGQHTAIGAASRGDIAMLPCLLIDVHAGEAQAAEDFVAVNANRITLTATQLFQARVIAGDIAATRVHAAVEAGGGRILRNPTPAHACEPGDTVALVALSKLKTPMITRIIAMGVRAGLGPIPGSFVKACTLMLSEQAWRTPEDVIVSTVQAVGMRKLTLKAARFKADFPLTAGEAMAKAIRASAPKEQRAA